MKEINNESLEYNGVIYKHIPEGTFPNIKLKMSENNFAYKEMQKQMKDNLIAQMPPFPNEENTVFGQLKITNTTLEKTNEELFKIYQENNILKKELQNCNTIISDQNCKLDDLYGMNSNLRKINRDLKETNAHSFRDGILVGLIPSLIILVLTIILTQIGVL